MKVIPIICIALLVVGALWAQKYNRTKGFSFSLGVLAAVIYGLQFPDHITSIGSFETKVLITPLLILLMFCMGTAMRFEDFVGVLKMPKGVLIGIICQFSIMPFIGLALTKLFSFPPEIAAGVILVGCSPSGLASNVMSYIAKANLALSLTLTAVATLLAPLVTPFLMKNLAGQLVPIDFWAMFMSIVKIVIIPILAGIIFNTLTKTSLQTLKSKAAKMDEQSCRTIALEVGMQNSGLASAIALEMGRVATMGLAPAVFGPFMNISGSCLASWWGEENES